MQTNMKFIVPQKHNSLIPFAVWPNLQAVLVVRERSEWRARFSRLSALMAIFAELGEGADGSYALIAASSGLAGQD
jgi:hypothetical protein